MKFAKNRCCVSKLLEMHVLYVVVEQCNAVELTAYIFLFTTWSFEREFLLRCLQPRQTKSSISKRMGWGGVLSPYLFRGEKISVNKLPPGSLAYIPLDDLLKFSEKL